MNPQYLSCAFSLHTQLQDEATHLVPQRKHHAAQRTDKGIQQVEDFLRRPAVFGDSTLDTPKLFAKLNTEDVNCLSVQSSREAQKFVPSAVQFMTLM